MRARGLPAILDRRPFEPIRIDFGNGRHLETAPVSRSLVAEGAWPTRRAAEHRVWYNPLHVVNTGPPNGRRQTARGARPDK